MRYRTLTFFALFLLVFTGSTGVAPAPAAPFDFDRAFGRLPKNVVPADYAIALVPNVAARTIAGTESIALRVRSATKTIQFNTLNETLRDVRFDGNPVAKVITENGKQLTTLTLPSTAAVGMHRLTFAYTARMETSQKLPEDYWRVVPLAGIKAFLVAKVPSDLRTFIDKGMERAQFDRQLDASLATATDAYLQAPNG